MAAADHVRDQPGPSGLVRGAEPGAIVPVEVLVEQQVVFPGRVVLQPLDPPEAGPPPVRADGEQGDEPVLQVGGDDSPVRLPREILGRPAQDLPLGDQLGLLGHELGLLRLQRRYPRPQRGQLTLGRQPAPAPRPTVRPGCDAPQDVASAPAVPAVAVWARTHSLRVCREIPKSAAIPRSVASGVDRYRSTAWRRNSSVWFLRAMIVDLLASPAVTGLSVSKIRGQGPTWSPLVDDVPSPCRAVE